MNRGRLKGIGAAVTALVILGSTPALAVPTQDPSTARIGSFQGIIFVGSFKKDGNLGVEYKAWRGYEVNSDFYKFSVHKMATFKGREIIWKKSWVTIDATTLFDYGGVVSSSERYGRVNGVEYHQSFRKGKFTGCAPIIGGCAHYYPEVALKIFACKGDSSNWPRTCGDAEYRTAG